MLANVAPKQCVELYEAVYVEGDLKKRKRNLQRDSAGAECAGVIPEAGAGVKIRPWQKGIKRWICQKTAYGIK